MIENPYSVFTSPYQLVPKSSFGSLREQNTTREPRKGTLLRFHFKENQVGYADCFPWPELGDQPLGTQLELLKCGELTPLTRRSVELARLDAQARAEGISLWDDQVVPSSHALVTDLKQLSASSLMALASQGFTHVKIKLGIQGLAECSLLNSFADVCQLLNLKFRLDFNGCLSSQEVDLFLRELGPILPWVDFIEDPCAYDPKTWTSIQNRFKVRLALDRWSPSPQLLPGAFSVLVVKPAMQDPEQMFQLAEKLGVSVMVTSYLDHPLGQITAAWVAANLARRYPGKLEVCGLLSQSAYEAHRFSESFRAEGPFMTPPKGTGFGMDSLLAEQPWRLL